MAKNMHDMYDILVGILNSFSDEKNQFWYDKEKINNFFYKQQPKYKILKEIPFDNDRIFPSSKLVDEAYSALRISSILTCTSLDFNPHYIGKSCRMAFEHYSKKRFNQEGLKELTEISEAFRKEFSLEHRVKITS